MNAPLHELVRVLGLPTALRLVEKFGGVRVYLPLAENMTDDNPIAAAIGVDAARDLCALWPQERPYIPRAVQILREERDKALLRDAEELSVPELARKYELTERAIYNVLKRGAAAAIAPATDQPELF